MRKSSTPSRTGVKVSAKEREKLIGILKPNIKQVVQEGVDKYIGNGTRFLLELLMHTEAQELCGRVYSRSAGRKLVRWGTEKGTGLIGGAKSLVERPRVRLKRCLVAGEAEIKLETQGNESLRIARWTARSRNPKWRVITQLRKNCASRTRVQRGEEEHHQPQSDSGNQTNCRAISEAVADGM
jgi:hypothetical protein